jgi:hypothetical protein
LPPEEDVAGCACAALGKLLHPHLSAVNSAKLGNRSGCCCQVLNQSARMCCEGV